MLRKTLQVAKMKGTLSMAQLLTRAELHLARAPTAPRVLMSRVRVRVQAFRIRRFPSQLKSLHPSQSLPCHLTGNRSRSLLRMRIKQRFLGNLHQSLKSQPKWLKAQSNLVARQALRPRNFKKFQRNRRVALLRARRVKRGSPAVATNSEPEQIEYSRLYDIQLNSSHISSKKCSPFSWLNSCRLCII